MRFLIPHLSILYERLHKYLLKLWVMNRIRKKIKISIIHWQDAAFSFDKKLPKTLPEPSITFGIIISQSEKIVNIGMNCTYSKNGKLKVTDGILIPRKAIVKIEHLDYHL